MTAVYSPRSPELGQRRATPEAGELAVFGELYPARASRLVVDVGEVNAAVSRPFPQIFLQRASPDSLKSVCHTVSSRDGQILNLPRIAQTAHVGLNRLQKNSGTRHGYRGP